MLKNPVTNDDHLQGKASASVTLVEYGDYQCPYCGEAYVIIKQIQEYFGPQLRFVFRNFPLSEIHPFAKPAAQIAEYAATEGLFWEMHDLIYENQDPLSVEFLFKLGESLGLSSANLKNALTDPSIEQKIEKDFMGGVRSGVNGTPSLFINGTRYEDAVEFENLVEAIQELIKN